MDYVISDLHFNHENVIDFERYEFNSIEEHDNYIIYKWNSTIVNNDDKIYVLGDIGFNDKTKVKELISKLRGYKILVKGNHDTFSNNFYLEAGFNEVYDHPIYYNKKVILSHEPVREALDNPYIFNIHGHLHNGCELTKENFYCVSAKKLKYKPMKLNSFIETQIPKLKSRKEGMGKEWYFDYYNFNDYKIQIVNNRVGAALTLEKQEPSIKGNFICLEDATLKGSFNKCIALGVRKFKRTDGEIRYVFTENGGFKLFNTVGQEIHFLKTDTRS